MGDAWNYIMQYVRYFIHFQALIQRTKGARRFSFVFLGIKKICFKQERLLSCRVAKPDVARWGIDVTRYGIDNVSLL
jgi:hypothetical protein